MPPRPNVILRRCNDYNADRIQAITDELIADLKVPITGKLFIKPNIVSANRAYIHDSYTHPTVTEGVVRSLRQLPDVTDMTLGESSGYGIPTELFFHEAGYDELAKRLGVRLLNINEDRLLRVALPKGVCHKLMLLSQRLHEADTKIWLPKLKYHIFASITQALKLNIGILTHKERMLYHDYRIHEKIVDLLEVGMPDLVISDAIRITYGFESAPYPVELGLLLGADDPLAADVVAAHIMGYQPEQVEHLRIAAERGYGSLKLEDIHIEGDYPLDELIAKPKGKTRLFQVLSELDTPIRFYAGRAAGTQTICDGGCEGALKGCLGTIEKRRPGSLARAKKGAIVTGVVQADIIMPDAPVLLIGDCTRVEGTLQARSVYRVKGCPVAARDLFIKVPLLFRVPSPMFDICDIVQFIRFSLRAFWRRALRLLRANR